MTIRSRVGTDPGRDLNAKIVPPGGWSILAFGDPGQDDQSRVEIDPGKVEMEGRTVGREEEWKGRSSERGI